MKRKLNYLTETEAKFPTKWALLQITFGLQSCKTKGDAIKLLEDAVELGRRKTDKSSKDRKVNKSERKSKRC
jgi:hypothetical protein